MEPAHMAYMNDCIIQSTFFYDWTACHRVEDTSAARKQMKLPVV